MKITIEIWQDNFNDEWMCDISLSSEKACSMEYFALENFCELLNLIISRFPKAKLNNKIESINE